MASRPELRTRRLRLRPPRAADAGRIQALAGARLIADTTASIPHPYPDGAAEDWIDDRRRAWRRDRSLALVVTPGEDEPPIGVVSLDGRGEGTAELGYWVGVGYWGRGYASEAAAAILHCGFLELGLTRVTARCLVRNPASARIITRLGLRHVERRSPGTIKRDRPEDVDVFEIRRDEDRASERLP
jgi:RimJ/RimL family protein N-acetyltransferase